MKSALVKGCGNYVRTDIVLKKKPELCRALLF